MDNMSKISQIHSLATAAHTIIYTIASLRWETNFSAKFIGEIDEICKAISEFHKQATNEWEKINQENSRE